MENMVVDREAMESASGDFAKASEPDIPQIDPPGSGHVSLMWGVPESDEIDAQRLRSAEVRELNGSDEELMARLKENSPNYFVDLVDLVLRRAVERVGNERVTPQTSTEVLGELLVADRDVLFKEIILTTFGNTRSYEDIMCPECGGGNDIHIEVDGLIQQTELKGDPSFTVELRDGREIAMHYPNGADQKFVYSEKEANSQAGYNTRMIGRCIDTVDDAPLRPHQAQKFALELGMADRRIIVTALASGPSVKFKEVEVPCTECGEAIPFAFGWADLLWV